MPTEPSEARERGAPFCLQIVNLSVLGRCRINSNHFFGESREKVKKHKRKHISLGFSLFFLGLSMEFYTGTISNNTLQISLEATQILPFAVFFVFTPDFRCPLILALLLWVPLGFSCFWTSSQADAVRGHTIGGLCLLCIPFVDVLVIYVRFPGTLNRWFFCLWLGKLVLGNIRQEQGVFLGFYRFFFVFFPLFFRRFLGNIWGSITIIVCPAVVWLARNGHAGIGNRVKAATQMAQVEASLGGVDSDEALRAPGGPKKG